MEAILRRILGSLFLLGLAGVFALGGLGFLGAAAYMGLTRWLPPEAAAGICGGAGFLIALGLLLLARSGGGSGERTPRSPRAREDRGDTRAPDAVARDLASKLLPALRRRAPAAAAGAFVVGVVLGISPRARKGLWRVVGRLLDQL